MPISRQLLFRKCLYENGSFNLGAATIEPISWMYAWVDKQKWLFSSRLFSMTKVDQIAESWYWDCFVSEGIEVTFVRDLHTE